MIVSSRVNLMILVVWKLRKVMIINFRVDFMIIMFLIVGRLLVFSYGSSSRVKVKIS